MEDQSFNEQANVTFAAVGRGKRVHYSPHNDETLCGRTITSYLDSSDAVARFNEGHELCAPCHRAAEKRAAAQLDALLAKSEERSAELDSLRADIATVAAEVDQHAAEVAAWGAEVDAATGQTAPQRDEPSDTWTIMTRDEVEIARVQGATVEEMTRAAEALPAVRANIRREGGFARRRLYTSELAPQEPAAEPRVVEGVVVTHAGTAEGSTPSNASHPDVVAARGALDGLAVATMTEHHDVTEPTEDEQHVRGYLVDPRTHGRVALYWLEGGRIVRRDQMPHGPALDCLADRLRRRGWAVEKMLRSSQCVFASRPAAEVDGPRCVHKIAARADVIGDPIAACARKESIQEVGVFNDEGCIEAYDCAVQAANEVARLNAEEDLDAADALYGWDLMCTEHREQQRDTCEECNAVAVEDQCPECKGKGCHDCYGTGEKLPEAGEVEVEADGTWRSGWIVGGPSPAGDALFDLGGDAEQGALFT